MMGKSSIEKVEAVSVRHIFVLIRRPLQPQSQQHRFWSFCLTMSAAGRLAKPQLRGNLNDLLKRNLWEAGALAFGTALAYKYLVAEPRKKRYAEFYRTYDAEAEAERMHKLGLFKLWEEIDETNEAW